MPTRKEILEGLNYEIEGLSDALRDNTNSRESMESLSEALKNHARSSETASQNLASSVDGLSDSIGNAAGTIIGGLVVSGVIGVVGSLLKEIFVQAIYLRKKSDMIRSMEKLRRENDILTYEFAMERSHAENSTKEERQNLLNELLHDGIIFETLSERSVKEIFINQSEAQKHWDRIDDIQKQLKKLT